jgi:hypothetical protein
MALKTTKSNDLFKLFDDLGCDTDADMSCRILDALYETSIAPRIKAELERAAAARKQKDIADLAIEDLQAIQGWTIWPPVASATREEAVEKRRSCSYPVLRADGNGAPQEQPCGSEERLYSVGYDGKPDKADICQKHVPEVWKDPAVQSAEPVDLGKKD